jgi:hypothetical protein
MSQTADAQGVDELLGVVDQLSGEFGTVPLGVLLDVVMGCHRDLTRAPLGAVPELVERLARMRLAAARAPRQP